MLLTAGRIRSSAPFVSVDLLRRSRRRRLLAALLLCLALTCMLLYVLKQQSISLSVLVGLLVLLPLFVRWIWQRPVRGVFVLVAASTVIEMTFSPTPYADDFGYYTPFFEDIQSWSHIRGPAFSIAEIFMVLLLLIWVLKGVAARDLHFNRGTLMRPLGFYMLMVAAGLLHGVTSGGDMTLALWEVRSQAYLFVAYVLGCNFVRTRADVNTIIGIIMVGTGIKGLQGVIRYYVEMGRDLHGAESVLPHEQSFFFNLFIIMTAILFLYGGPRRLKTAALILLPGVLVAALANQRRAAVLALLVAACVLLIGTAVAHERKRKLIMIILLVLAVTLPVYYEVYKNKGGLVAEPARAVSSAFNPDQRDAGSNQYRAYEDGDILATMRTSPIIGYGYGKYFLTPYQLVNISTFYNFYLLEPHDSVLWVWMRVGTVGYLLFWFTIGTAIVQAARLARLVPDPYLKGVALFCLTTIIQEVIFGYLDLQWVNYRNIIVIGIMLALIGRLYDVAESERTTTNYPVQRRPRLRVAPRSTLVALGAATRAPERSSVLGQGDDLH